MPNGLSPLARGTRINQRTFCINHRFIPAGAGNTQFAQLLSAHNAVYPRWRGEHLLPVRDGDPAPGLSPLARGTRGNCRNGRVDGRFIPAGAGNTRRSLSCRGIPAVYPRWRGEHFKLFAVKFDIAGLSPLARGTLLEYMVELKCIFKDLKSYQIFSPSEKTQPFDL